MEGKRRCSIIGCEAIATEKHHVWRPSSLRIWVCAKHHGELHGADGWDTRHSSLIRAGIAKAKAEGRIGGNPKIRDPAINKAMGEARNARFFARFVASANEWLPVVREVRAAGGIWPEIANAVSEKLGVVWTQERVRRSVGKLVAAGLAEKSLLVYAPPRLSEAHKRLVPIIKAASRGKTLAQIARHMEAIGELTPRGSTKWHPSSVRNLLKSKRAPSRLPSPPVSARQHSLRL